MIEMKIYIGADHRGFETKEGLKRWLVAEGFEVVDLGNQKYDPEDDFPDFALKVSERVAIDDGVGVLLCGSGGMALAANKVKGVRAAEVFDVERAIHAKSHDDVNVLALPTDAIDLEEAKNMVKAWLDAPLKKEEKYLRRLKKVAAIEEKYFK